MTIALLLFLLLPASSSAADTTGLAPTMLRAYPSDAAAFQPDVAPWVDSIVARHGREEWHAVMLTHELHRHMGIYNVVGAKMGVRARELLGAPRDDVSVESFIGHTPPMSCMNDGLQVGTGATLGRGTITVHPKLREPRAVIRHGTRSAELRLRAEILDRIREDIGRLAREHTYGSPGYFAAVRTLSMRYWLDLDRAAIFHERKLP